MGNLLHWAIVFLVVAVIAGFLGFGGVRVSDAEHAFITEVKQAAGLA